MNYAEHNKELDTAFFKQENPVIFMKPSSAYQRNGRPFFVPSFSNQVDYEAELVFRVSRLGKSIGSRFALRYVDAVTVGIDFTARDMQRRCMAEGLPWDLCKGFDSSAVTGDFIPLEELGTEPGKLHFRLDIDGQTVQDGHAEDMIFPLERIIEYVSGFCTLKTGDLIYTGTPKGVGPVHPGQHLQGWLEDRKVLDFHIR